MFKIKIIIISITIILGLFSCSDSKDTQCKKIVQVVNQVVNDTRTLTNEGKTQDRQAILKAADITEKAAKDMEQLNITDERLKGLQFGFSTMYRDMSKATRDMLNALNKKNFPAFDAGLKKWQKAYGAETQLVNGINNYCVNK